MDCDGGIAKHGFGTSGSDHYVIRFAGLGINDGVHEVPEVALGGFVFDFVIADGSVQMCVPVDQAFAAVDAFFFEQVKERRAHGGRAGVVERKSSPLEIAAGAHLL